MSGFIMCMARATFCCARFCSKAITFRTMSLSFALLNEYTMSLKV